MKVLTSCILIKTPIILNTQHDSKHQQSQAGHVSKLPILGSLREGRL